MHHQCNFVTKWFITAVIGLIVTGISASHAQGSLPGTPGPITGPSTASAGTNSEYSTTAGTNATGFKWTVTSGAGTIVNGGGLMVNIAWNSSYSGSAVVSCASTNSSGTSAAQTKTVTITASVPIVPGTISTPTPDINSGTQPSITAPAASGGNGVYTYQWQSSPTGNTGTWVYITVANGGTSQTYNPPVLTATTWYQRIVTSNGISSPGNPLQIIVSPQLLPGTITPSSQSALPGGSLVPLTCTSASGGYGTINYQWQSSADNGITAPYTNITAVSSSITPLTLGAAAGTIYYRLAVINNNQVLYTLPSSVLVSDCNQLGTNATIANNYIITSTLRASGYTSLTDAQIAALGVCQANQSIQYLDGLGRPLQTVQVKASPAERDIVEPVAYDQYGREAIKYLPYTATVSNSDGSYKSTAITDQASFYNNPGSSAWNAPGVVTIPANGSVTPSYAQTGYEPSPMNRVIEQGAPGAAWQLPGSGSSSSTGNTIRTVYTVNDQTSTFSSVYTPGTPNPGSRIVALYTTLINGGTSTQRLVRAGNAYYSPGTLYVTITRDENWQPAKGCLGTTEEYKDMLGHIVLRRTYNLSNNTVQMLSTYYVYDDIGNLAFVLPPGATPDNAGTPSQLVLDNFCYQYNYDGRSRPVAKKIPGKGWEYMAYNTLDQLVATQDSVQRMKSTQQASYMAYDGMSRPVMSGVYNVTGAPGSNTRATIQAAITSLATLWESRITTSNGYTGATLPPGFTMYTTNYYDDLSMPGLPSTCATPAGASIMTRGLQTATVTAVLNTPSATLWKASFYDDLGRITQSYAQHYLGAVSSISNYDVVSNNYDFSNEVISSTRKHYNMTNNASSPVLSISNTYSYDHQGRKKQIMEQINGSATVLLVDNEYNELGQVITKNQGGINGGGTGSQANVTLSSAVTSGQTAVTATNSITMSPGFSVSSGATFTAQINGYLQTTNYTYNERGWLTTINNPASVNAGQVFGEQLQYTGGVLPQYNGNISGISWQTMVAPGSGLYQQQQSYSYTYDNLNRLQLAVYTSGGVSGKFNEQVNYDLMGNITGLQRTSTTTAGQYLNNLTYDYSSMGVGNKLWSVTDGGTAAQGSNYQYDPNGNVISDTHNQVTNIAYNLLNLPQTIARTAGNITYVYDATGVKLEKVSGGITRDYISGIEYNNGEIDFVATEEGRAIPVGGNYSYEYYQKDHLGNTRAVVKDDGSIVQIQDYYPFGLEMNPGNSVTPSPLNQYKYNGKEEQIETGQYDYGARFYNPVIGRWNTPDPMAENALNLTPFRYAFNNPVRMVDPNGAYEEDGHFWTVYLMLTEMNNNDAFNISYWTEWPDMKMAPSGDVMGYNNSWIQPFSQQRIHALTGGFSAMERNTSYGYVETAGDTFDLGLALHRLGDSYAHSKFGDEGRMYGAPFFSFGHAYESGATDPDAIRNRPWLYTMYVDRLEQALRERFGFKGNIDTFAFDYVADLKGTTKENDAILETEVRIRQGVHAFSVAGDQVGLLNNYIKARNKNSNGTIRPKITYGTVDIYNRAEDGSWIKTTENRTFITY